MLSEARLIPWVTIGAAPIPGGSEDLRLMRRGGEHAIFLGAVELMNTRLSGSEEALAAETCRRLTRARPRLLIGGLGMGFTLRAALAALPADAEVVVAELVSAVVTWARGPLAGVFAGCLDDPRLTVREDDVAEAMRMPNAWDAILLDVDNGPAGQTRSGNDALYGMQGLAAACRALRPGGLLSVWSVDPDASFVARLRQAGFTVEELTVRANARKRGARHTIWVARRS